MRALPSALAFLSTLVLADPALAACPVADAKVEKAIATKPELRGGAGAQVARDLRTLRDAAVVLDAYDPHGACKQIVAVLNTLIFLRMLFDAGPVGAGSGTGEGGDGVVAGWS